MPNWNLELPCQDEDEPDELQNVYDDLDEALETIKYLRKRIAELEAKLGPEEPF